MLGAIIGDVTGSRFEWDNLRSKEFDLLTDKCFMTDDSYMTIAVADALMNRKDDDTDLSAKAIASMQRIGRRYPDCGFGGRFFDWIFDDDPQPYHSYGNGAAMRVSACVYRGLSYDGNNRRGFLRIQQGRGCPGGGQDCRFDGCTFFLGTLYGNSCV